MPDVRAGEKDDLAENMAAILESYRTGWLTRAEVIAMFGRAGLGKPAICAALNAIDWEKQRK